MINAFTSSKRLTEEIESIFFMLSRKFIAAQGTTGVEKYPEVLQTIKG